ncbi:MAG: biotin/lipoyl-binding protein, partial [Firmicutes bacterium]|nr:biotin/lipoyl-binding protein [Bacillota bacterium]
MRKFNISVNGKTYEVEVEEVKSKNDNKVKREVKSTPKQKPKAKPVKKVQKPQPKPKETKINKAPSGGETIDAPMPGSVFDIKVSEGDTVNKGDVLLILEAMKMENEIVAPRDGKVVAI